MPSEVIIRPSALKLFFDCPYKWYRNTLSKEPIRSSGIAAHLGGGVHKAAETYYRECISAKKWENPGRDYSSVAIDEFRERVKENEDAKFEASEVASAEKLVVSCSRNYIAQAPSINREIPVAVEKQYSYPLCNLPNGDKLVLQGTLDIVYNKAIGDIKTMNKLKSPSQYALQQSAYALLRKLNKEEVDNLYIHRVLTKEDKNTVDSQSIIESMENPYVNINTLTDDIKAKLEIIVNTVKLYYKTGDEVIFRGNPSSLLCSNKYCAYYNQCKYKGVK